MRRVDAFETLAINKRHRRNEIPQFRQSAFPGKQEALKGNTLAMANGLMDHIWTIKELILRTKS